MSLEEHPVGSGKVLVLGMLFVVLLVSVGASMYAMHLRSDTPHSEEDHPDSEPLTPEERDREEREEHMRSIGYVQ